jgi:hypothetical protein
MVNTAYFYYCFCIQKSVTNTESKSLINTTYYIGFIIVLKRFTLIIITTFFMISIKLYTHTYLVKRMRFFYLFLDFDKREANKIEMKKFANERKKIFG